ncbi:MAG: hypothetical protein HY808_05450 [Nitrospirae bacterium]|nr:hypothetical protein [Nitrospirota bacterium]
MPQVKGLKKLIVAGPATEKADMAGTLGGFLRKRRLPYLLKNLFLNKTYVN